MKIALFVSSALAATLMATSPGSALAQGTAPSTETARSPGQVPARLQPGGDGIAANGRCGGVSFGTGARRCGDGAGGPSGGINSRN